MIFFNRQFPCSCRTVSSFYFVKFGHLSIFKIFSVDKEPPCLCSISFGKAFLSKKRFFIAFESSILKLTTVLTKRLILDYLNKAFHLSDLSIKP